MTERLRVENLYKIFAPSPIRAMTLLATGADKARVLAETDAVVGLNNVSLSVPSGAIYMVMGLSGSGKSTLARCINRLNEPTAGKILLDDIDIVPLREDALRELRRTRISMVFQHFALLPNKSVIENAEFGLKLRGVSAAQRRRRAEEVLAIVGLAKWAYHRPHELSGGMRQRVGLARALATDADVLIMDEAFSALDPLIRTEMQDELLRLQHTLKKTILFITHDFQEALKLGTRIAIMSEGELVREGTPQSIVLEPGSDYVAAFTREVDRSRLFDARSVMRTGSTVSSDGSARIVGDAEHPEAMSFAIDASNRIVGCLDAAALQQVKAGKPVDALLTRDFVAVSGTTKLVDVAGLYQSGKAMAVIDEDGCFLGMLEPEHILGRIASAARSPAPASMGGHNA